MTRKKIKVLINADCSILSINAQDRNGKHWAMFLDPEVFHLCIFYSGAIDERIKEKTNIKFVALPQNRVVELIKIFFLFISFRPLLILNQKHSYRELLILIFIKLFRLKTKMFSVAVSQVPYGEDFKRETKIANYILGNSDILAGNSARVAKTAEKYFHKKILVVNNFYDLDLFSPKEHSNERLKIICVSSMLANKQPFLFANIAKQLKEADFIWVGKRFFYDDMVEKKEREGIDNLFLPGEIPNNKLPSILSEADIFLYPSILDGFPSVIVEAMACGLPVIAFDRFGPEAVIDNVTGFVVFSEFEMLEKLSILIRNAEFRKNFSHAARKRALEYDGNILVKQLEQILINSVKPPVQ